MVRFFGAMYREGDVWICMEVMDISLDKFYRLCVDMGRKLPEPFLARVAYSVKFFCLIYLNIKLVVLSLFCYFFNSINILMMFSF